MEYLKVDGEGSELSEGESIEKGDKDDEGESPATTSPAHQSFEEALHG